MSGLKNLIFSFPNESRHSTELAILYFFAVIFPKRMSAADPITTSFDYASAIGGGSLGVLPLQDIMVSIINVLLSFLAVIFINMIIIGGAKYYTGHFNEEERHSAVSTLKSGIIGTMFIVFAMSISQFVLNNVSTATGGALTF